MTTTHTTAAAPDTDPGPTSDGPGARFVLAHVDQLLDNPADVRAGDRDPAALAELAHSIRTAGIVQALTVVPAADEGDGQRSVIYAGHQRRDAARLAAAQVLAEACDPAPTPTSSRRTGTWTRPNWTRPTWTPARPGPGRCGGPGPGR